MALSFAQGNFTKATGAAPVDQSISSLSFQPEALILWATQNTSGGSSIAHAMFVMGFASAAGVEASCCIWSRDATSLNDSKSRVSTDKIITFIDTATGLLAEADLKSFDSNGFTLTWTTNDASAYIIHYIALAGDITNAFVSSFALNTSTGDQAVSGVGFQPDFLLMLGTNQTTAGTGETAMMSLGAGTSTAETAISYASKDNTGTVTHNVARSSRHSTILSTHTSLVGIDALATLSTMDSDGFTINISDAPASATLVLYLALKGGSYSVGEFDSATSTGNQAETGAGFQPVGYALFSHEQSYFAETGTQGSATMNFGATDGTNQSTGVVSDEHAAIDTYQRADTDKVLTLLTIADGTLIHQGTHVSFDSDGFTVNWGTAEAAANDIHWIAFGNGVAASAADRRRLLAQVIG